MADRKKCLGIIGGMGAQATACFYEILHDQQCVASEQEYLDVLLYSIPSVPDRTAYITGQSTECPLERLIHAARTLETAGASCIVIPCATSHFFLDDLIKAVDIPILNMLEETARYVKECGIGSVCLLATDGTIEGGFFHKAFKKYAIEATVPSECIQADLMELIYNIKRGEAVSADVLDSIITKACDGDTETVVLGCTELCVITNKTRETDADKAYIKNQSIISTLDVLAEASIAFLRD